MAFEPQTGLTIAFDPAGNQDDIHVLHAGLSAYNQRVLGPERYQPFRIYVRDAEGKIVGGLLGDLYFEWVYIAILWLQEELRGQGIGTRLMAMAEEYAAAEGRRYAHVDTFDFQAPGFYKRLGYTVMGELSPYGDGHTRIYLRKALPVPDNGGGAQAERAGRQA